MTKLQTQLKMPDTEVTYYDNGIVHLHYYVERMLNFNVAIYINAGSTSEIKHEEFGAAHFLEHMVFNGSNRFPDSKELDIYMGNRMLADNAWTWCNSTCYFIIGPNDQFSSAFEILFNRVYDPILREKDAKKERGIIIEELKMNNSNQENFLDMKISEKLFGNSAYAHEVLGDLKSLNGMNSDILRDFHKRNYTYKNSVVVTYGGIDKASINKVLEKYFKANETDKIDKSNKINDLSLQNTLITKLSKKLEVPFDCEIPTYNISIILNITKLDIESLLKTYFVYILLAGGNGSILQNELVYKSAVVSDFFVSFAPFKELLLFTIGFNAEDSKLKKAKIILESTLKEFIEKDISEIDFERAKNYILGIIYTELDSQGLITKNSVLSTGYIFSNYGILTNYSEITSIIAQFKVVELKSFIQEIFQYYLQNKGFVEGCLKPVKNR